MARLIETVYESEEQPPCKTAAQMELVCCEPTEPLQCCETSGVWNGYTPDELTEMLGLELDSEGRNSKGEYVVFEFPQRNHPCGELVTKYDTTPGKCCDDVEPIVVDDDASPKILPRGETVLIFWEGGKHPFNIHISGQSVYLPGGERNIDLLSGDRVISVTALDSFCGSAIVRIRDNCGYTVYWDLLSDWGEWKLMNMSSTSSIIPGVVPYTYGYPSSVHTFTAILGRYKSVESVELKAWEGACVACGYTGSGMNNYPMCMDSPCPGLVVDYIEGLRPSGYNHQTDLSISWEYFKSVQSGAYYILYEYLSDGGIVEHINSLCSYSCTVPPLNTYGSRNRTFGKVMRSLGCKNYQWACP